MKKMDDSPTKEERFWSALEWLVCREMAGDEECREHALWCDGFLPEDYHFGLSGCYVTGRVWICFGQDQHQWEFRCDLPKGTRDLTEVDWVQLLPAEDVTRWLAVDHRNMRIEISPQEAIDDARAD